MYPKVLIIGTVPYNPNSSSRAFDAYFHNWDKSNLRQIFSNTKTPIKGHCEKLYQITDLMMLKNILSKGNSIGKKYEYNNLPTEWTDNSLEITKKDEKFYKIGRTHTPLIKILRGLLWSKKRWCTKDLIDWVDSFEPDAIFLAFSDDYFINRMALYFSKKYSIPIIPCIGDDYYFNTVFTINPIYWLYKLTYKKMIRSILTKTFGAIYISDKIKNKYNNHFNIIGETVYLTSTLERKIFKPIEVKMPYITYFGNIRMGRNKSLCDIADALKTINSQYVVTIFSNELDKKYFEVFSKHKNIVFRGSIPYNLVQKEMLKSDITLIVEGFKKIDISKSRFSLSTKAADTLKAGVNIFSYGSSECGIIEYMNSTSSSMVCTSKEQLVYKLKKFLDDVQLQKNMYDNQQYFNQYHHNLEISTETSKKVIVDAINFYKEDSHYENN